MPLNIAIGNNYHTYNPFIKLYYFSSPVMMLSFQSILQKTNIALIRFIWQVNDSLREQCILNRFGFISNDKISITYLSKNGIHLEN